MSNSTEIPWPISVQRRLRALRANRINAKTREQDLIETRDNVKKQIIEMGKKPTPERLELDHELVEAISEIEYQRGRLRWLADQMERTIDDADQGKLFDEEQPDDLRETAFRAPPAKKPAEPEATPLLDTLATKPPAATPAPAKAPKKHLVPEPVSEAADPAPAADVDLPESDPKEGWLRMPGRFLLESGTGKNVKEKRIVAYSIGELHDQVRGSLEGGAYTAWKDGGDHARVLVGSKVAIKVSRIADPEPQKARQPKQPKGQKHAAPDLKLAAG